MDNYNVASFYEPTFAKPSGPTIWSFLNAERTVGKMGAASFYKRPGVEPLGLDLIALFPGEHRDEILDDTCKRMVGHMVKQVMEAHGYETDNEHVPMSDNVLFKTDGASYKRKQ